MPETLVAPAPHHFPSRFWMIAMAVALVVAAVVTIVVLIVAVRGGNETNEPLGPAAELPARGADFTGDVCVPSRVPVAC